MMFKATIRIIALSFIVISLIVNSYAYIVPDAESKGRVLLVYDTRSETSSTNDDVFTIKNLLYHFNVSVDVRQEATVNRAELASYDYIFIISNTGLFHNQELFTALSKTEATICFIGEGLAQFSRVNGIPLQVEEVVYDYTEVIYNYGEAIMDSKLKFGNINNYLPISEVIITSNEIEVYSGVSNGSKFNPTILKYKNTWIITFLEFYGDIYQVFSDILYEIFDYSSYESNSIFIRIEDVHPFRDQDELRQIADYLSSANVPFMIALIPAYKGTDNMITHMEDVPGFADTIKYMADKGASVILHGYTHAGYGEVSGEGFEFWDGINDAPISDVNEAQYIDKRIYWGLKNCVENGIYPLAFEPPHYAISSNGFKQVSKYFSTFCGQLQVSDTSFSTVELPYQLHNTDTFETVIPENLGYVNGVKSSAISEIKSKFLRLKRIRGYSGGMFFHPDIKLEYLKQLIDFFKEQRVSFYDLKSQNNWVKSDDISIISTNGSIHASSNLTDNSVNEYFSYVNIFLIVLLSLILLVLFIVFLRFRQLNKVRFIKGIKNEAKFD